MPGTTGHQFSLSWPSEEYPDQAPSTSLESVHCDPEEGHISEPVEAMRVSEPTPLRPTKRSISRRNLWFYLVVGSLCGGVSGVLVLLGNALLLDLEWPTVVLLTAIIFWSLWNCLTYAYPFGHELREQRPTDWKHWPKQYVKVLDKVETLLNHKWNGLGQAHSRASQCVLLLSENRPLGPPALRDYWSKQESTLRSLSELTKA